MIKPTIVQNAVDPDIFIRSNYNEKIEYSEEDDQFIRLMDEEFQRDCEGSWKATENSRRHETKWQFQTT